MVSALRFSTVKSNHCGDDSPQFSWKKPRNLLRNLTIKLCVPILSVEFKTFHHENCWDIQSKFQNLISHLIGHLGYPCKKLLFSSWLVCISHQKCKRFVSIPLPFTGCNITPRPENPALSSMMFDDFPFARGGTQLVSPDSLSNPHGSAASCAAASAAANWRFFFTQSCGALQDLTKENPDFYLCMYVCIYLGKL